MEQIEAEIRRRRESTTLRWYPLRIFHSSLPRQRAIMETLNAESAVAETYVPQALIDAETQQYAPALLNYIFVRISLLDLKQLKALPRFGHLRYVMRFERDGEGRRLARIAHITDREMDNFRQVILHYNEQVEYIQNNAFAFRPGQMVRITEGTFAGIEGTLKSIRKHVCVVVALSGIMAVAITGIHRKHLAAV